MRKKVICERSDGAFAFSNPSGNPGEWEALAWIRISKDLHSWSMITDVGIFLCITFIHVFIHNVFFLDAC